jgi:hypothetical protein
MKKPFRLKHILLLVLLTSLAAGLIAIAPWGRRVYHNARALQSMAVEARTLKDGGLKPESLPLALNLAGRAGASVSALRADISPFFPLFQRLGSLPRFGAYFLAVEPGLDTLDNLTRAAVLLCQAAFPLVSDPPADAPVLSPPEKIAALLAEQQPDLDQAEAFLKKAAASAARIDPAIIPQKYLSDFSRVKALFQQASSAFQALRLLNPLLGSPTPRTYLLLVQNRDEIRPSGGFVSAFGLLRLDAGRISMLEIVDSTLYDYVREVRRAPEPIEKIMMANYLVARDANWSPDFPTAARPVQEMYFISTDIPTDGVIAFDQGFIARLLAFLGPISVPNEKEPITDANVESRMIAYKQAAIDVGNLERRKDFLSVLAPYIIQKLYGINQVALQVDLARQMLEAHHEGHLLVYLNDPPSQEMLRQVRLDASISPGKGDFLMLVSLSSKITRSSAQA